MREVPRGSEPAPSIWEQRRETLDVIAAGDVAGVEAWILAHPSVT
jgi:hypothetical protein